MFDRFKDTQGKMPEIFKAYLSNYMATTRTIEMPNGKCITIASGEPYLTADKDELKFLANQRFIALVKANEKEIYNFMFNPENLPKVVWGMNFNPALVAMWKWAPAEEEKIAGILKARGWDVKKTEPSFKNEENDKIETQRMIDRLTTLGYTITEPKSEIEQIKADQDLEKMQYKDLQKAYAELGGKPIGITQSSLILLIKKKRAEAVST